MLRRGRRGSLANRSSMTEHDIADARLAGFDPRGSNGEKLLQAISGENKLTRCGLSCFCSVLAALSAVPLPRDMTRRKVLLVKWMDLNYDTLEPFVKFMVLHPIE
jgi:hypothetical protein